MNIFKRLLPNYKQHGNDKQQTKGALIENYDFPLTNYDEISKLYREPFTDHYLINAWVSIAINILIRNLARADFVLERDGEEVKNGLLYNLFHRPNPNLSRYDLWKETAAWWHLEGEAFWWFGPDYSGGIPKEIYILNPVNCNRRLPVQGA